MTSREILEGTYESQRLMPRWLRIPHAVAYSGISRSKLYELFAAGLVRSVRIDGSRRVPVEELESYVTRLLNQEEAAHAEAS